MEVGQKRHISDGTNDYQILQHINKSILFSTKNLLNSPLATYNIIMQNCNPSVICIQHSDACSSSMLPLSLFLYQINDFL